MVSTARRACARACTIRSCNGPNAMGSCCASVFIFGLFMRSDDVAGVVDPIGQNGRDDAVRLRQTLHKWALESDGVNGIKFRLHEFGTLVQPLQKRDSVFDPGRQAQSLPAQQPRTDRRCQFHKPRLLLSRRANSRIFFQTSVRSTPSSRCNSSTIDASSETGASSSKV